MKKVFMKFIPILLMCIFFASTTFSSAENDKKIEIVQTQKAFPNIFRPITDFVKKIFGKKTKTSVCHIPFAKIKSVTVSYDEVENCSINDKNFVEVTAETNYPDYIIYKYYVSGGKVLENRNTPLNYGNKDKVVWDLTGVSIGEYTIDVSVDNGCEDCSPHITKTIKVVDCPK